MTPRIPDETLGACAPSVEGLQRELVQCRGDLAAARAECDALRAEVANLKNYIDEMRSVKTFKALRADVERLTEVNKLEENGRIMLLKHIKELERQLQLADSQMLFRS